MCTSCKTELLAPGVHSWNKDTQILTGFSYLHVFKPRRAARAWVWDICINCKKDQHWSWQLQMFILTHLVISFSLR